MSNMLRRTLEAGDAVRIALTFFVVLMSGCLAQNEPLPSDASLEERFPRIRADLEQIQKMSDEDASVIRIASDFTWLKDNVGWPRPEENWGISRARWDAYRAVFERIECPDGLFRKEGILYVICGTRGMATAGAEKGYAYATSMDPERVVTELDSARPAAGRPYFKRLAEPWFLYVH